MARLKGNFQDLSLFIKWKHLPAFLVHRINAVKSNNDKLNLNGFEAASTRLMLRSIKFDRSWCHHWCEPIEAAINDRAMTVLPGDNCP
jgi:hypothetical protein